MRGLILIGFMCFCAINIVHAGYLPEEIRVGALKHDIRNGLSHKHEKGYDVNAEFLWASPQFYLFEFIFSPRPHLGASINTRGGSDQFYLGLTWRYDFLEYLFVDGSLGGEVHTGKINHKTSRKQALGTRFLFRESIGLGVQINETHSVSMILDHASNASTSSRNPGLTAFGLRYGFRF